MTSVDLERRRIQDWQRKAAEFLKGIRTEPFANRLSLEVEGAELPLEKVSADLLRRDLKKLAVGATLIGARQTAQQMLADYETIIPPPQPPPKPERRVREESTIRLAQIAVDPPSYILVSDSFEVEIRFTPASPIYRPKSLEGCQTWRGECLHFQFDLNDHYSPCVLGVGQRCLMLIDINNVLQKLAGEIRIDRSYGSPTSSFSFTGIGSMRTIPYRS